MIDQLVFLTCFWLARYLMTYIFIVEIYISNENNSWNIHTKCVLDFVCRVNSNWYLWFHLLLVMDKTSSGSIKWRDVMWAPQNNLIPSHPKNGQYFVIWCDFVCSGEDYCNLKGRKKVGNSYLYVVYCNEILSMDLR